MTATEKDRDTQLHEAGLDGQNRTALGRLLGTGSVGHAEEGSDGVMRATVRIPEDELIWEPSILVFPHGGDVELTLINDDKNTHCAVLPNNGDPKIIWLVNHSKGTARLNLGGPGTTTYTLSYYLYQVGFQQFHISQATAGSWLFLVVLTLAVMFLVRRMLRPEAAR